jgi:hypothetical protein
MTDPVGTFSIPTVGLGSIDLSAFAKAIAPYLAALQTPSPTPSPTPTPTPSPTPSDGVTWMYLNGVKTLAGDFTGNGQTVDYQHATPDGPVAASTLDILVTSTVNWAIYIPYWAADYKLPNPGYKSLLLSLKPSITGDTFGIHAERAGDVDDRPHIELMQYGPAAQAGVWGSYVIPLADLGVAGDATLYKIVLQSHTASANSFELDAIGFQ